MQSSGAPPFPESEWENILSGKSVDLDKVFSGIFPLGKDDKQVEHLGDFKLSHTHTSYPSSVCAPRANGTNHGKLPLKQPPTRSLTGVPSLPPTVNTFPSSSQPSTAWYNSESSITTPQSGTMSPPITISNSPTRSASPVCTPDSCNPLDLEVSYLACQGLCAHPQLSALVIFALQVQTNRHMLGFLSKSGSISAHKERCRPPHTLQLLTNFYI